MEEERMLMHEGMMMMRRKWRHASRWSIQAWKKKEKGGRGCSKKDAGKTGGNMFARGI